MNKGLWTKDFTLITIGTIISVIASQVISLPISLLVFDETKSTLLSSFIFIANLLPSTVIPILIAPLIDNAPKKRLIVCLDYLSAAFNLLVGVIVIFFGFKYLIFVAISFIAGCIGAVYTVAYRAWYPDLITKGYEQKGYAVSSTIYPSVTIVFAPIAAYLYSHISIDKIFFIVSVLIAIAATAELFIKENFQNKDSKITSFSEYKSDFLEGLRFIKNERGIRNIYLYMGIANGTGVSNSLIIQAFFQTSAVLTSAMLGFLKSAETMGRLIGGIFQYKIEIPANKRYKTTKLVYIFYEMMDMLLLFLPYPIMIANRFFCGALGMTSATLRETAVQSYLPSTMRAKVNAFFTAYFSITMIIFQFLAGYLGDIMSYRKVMILLSGLTLIFVFILIILPQRDNEKVYRATRVEKE